MSVLDKRGKIQKLLGVELPSDAADLQCRRWQPSSELSYYTAYIRFRVSPRGFLDLMGRMHASQGPSPYLPAAWEAEPSLKLAWWDPSPNTPPESAARSFGMNGWMVAKHERGRAYIVVTDTGYSELK